MRPIASILVLFSMCGCTSASGPGDAGVDAAYVFSSAVTNVTFEIDYGAGAAPYTGSAGDLANVWDIAQANVARLFQASAKPVTLPTALDAMEELPDVTATTYTEADIVAIAAAHESPPASSEEIKYYALFLPGYYDDGTGAQDQVLGLAVHGTRIFALFKPVIASTETSYAGVSRYVEQSTFVHELGHAVGLVDDGLALTSAHWDSAHGYHCTNPQCVMFWENEGASSTAMFVREARATSSLVSFGSECLADVDSASK